MDDVDSLYFEKADDVGKFLMERPPEWAQVIATRMALRVFPSALNAVRAPDDWISKQQKRILVLLSFRAGFVSWAAGKYAGVDMAAISAAAKAAAAMASRNSDTSADNYAAARAATYAAAAANATYEPVANAAVSYATTAVAAATDAVGNAPSGLMETLSFDCQRLLGAMKPDELIRQPLWSQEVREDGEFQANQPVWAFQAFKAFANSEWIKTAAGRVIAEWYQALVPFEGNESRSAFGEEADIVMATQPDTFWTPTEGRGFDAIWEDIETLSRGGTIEPLSNQKQEEEDPQDTDADLGETPDNPEDDKDPPAKINVAVQFDQYARKDELGRKRFAEILATRIGELHEGGGPDGLAVNLHAPWGAGKTTVLHFMKGFLEAEQLPADKRWVVIDFNAWQHEHRRPPWWPFLKAVKSQLSDRLIAQKRRTRAGEVRHTWQAWQLRAEAPPYLAGFLVVSLVLTLIWSGSSDIAKSILSGIGGILAVITAATLYSRKVFFGSSKSASLYHDYASDPLEKLSLLFKDMIEAADAPVCIFVDDLDRCQNDFVVEFLEGLQTSFRHRKVAYVIAADKFWIKTSFEDKYASFCEKTADRTQPLGYQFLEKIFQFNVPLPGMAAWKKRYLQARLGLMGTGSGGTGDGERFGAGLGSGTGAGIETGTGRGDVPSPEEAEEDQEVERLRGEIRSTQPEGLTHETVRTLSTGDGSNNPAYQAALALEYTTSQTARREAEHFLFQYLELLPDNPRVIKRIINAFGMAVATAILERQVLDYDILTRWTILEQCYPAVADELTGDPDLAETLLAVDADGGEDLTGLADTLAAFCEKKMAVKLLKNGDAAVLTPVVIRRLTRGVDEAAAAAV
eukprot:g2036.t1